MDEKKPLILIIDDDDVIRLACELTLKEEGMSVETAENGILGLEKLKTKNFDLILLDLMMPEISGEELLVTIKEYDKNSIIIVITGFGSIESAVKTLKKGAYDYIPKPFSPEELRKVVRKGLERRKLLLEAEALRQEREQNLIKLASEQSRLITIINCMGEGLIATDRDANLILINPVACKLLGIKEPCQIGKNIKGYLNNVELENLICDILKRKKFPKKYITKEIIFSKEENKIYSINLAPIKKSKGEISGLALVLRDISEQKKLEKMKSEFQKLVSVVAHELKAPINTIEGYLDLIIKGFVKDKPDKHIEYIIRSRDKAQTLRHLIEDLLSLTSIESGKITQQMEPVDIKQIIVEILNFMEVEARIKRIKIIHDFPKQLPLVNGDKNSLNFLFTNLISNAIKYNKENGSITIKAVIENKYLVISFIDTGLGISEDDQNRIFDEFYRSNDESIQKIAGTGLGLNITKRIADLHNGFIKVISRLGEGSQFDVYLPITKSDKSKS